MNFFNSIVDSLTNSQTAQTITLTAGHETHEVSAEDAQGKTISELFSEYADELGIDSARPARYVDAGQQVSGTSHAKPGRVYSSAVSFESKG